MHYEMGTTQNLVDIFQMVRKRDTVCLYLVIFLGFGGIFVIFRCRGYMVIFWVSGYFGNFLGFVVILVIFGFWGVLWYFFGFRGYFGHFLGSGVF